MEALVTLSQSIKLLISVSLEMHDHTVASFIGQGQGVHH